MAGLITLLAASVLLLVPSFASRLMITPARLAATSVWAVGIASLVALSTLAICATMLLGRPSGRNGGFSGEHLVAAAPISGWISLFILIVGTGSGARALYIALHRQRSLRERLRWAEIDRIDGVPFVTLPTDEFIAASVPGGDGCVLMSAGALTLLSPPQVRAVIHHENAHHRLGHHRHLLFARVADRLLWFLPGSQRATRALRQSLELAADAESRRIVSSDDVRSALNEASNSSGTSRLRYRRFLDAGPAPQSAVAALFACTATVSIVAVGLELSWLGFGV